MINVVCGIRSTGRICTDLTTALEAEGHEVKIAYGRESVPAEHVPKILSNVNAGFISFVKTPLWENTIPAKLQSYLACGRAIIASVSGETERVITEADCSVCCEIGNAVDLANGRKRMIGLDS